MEVSPMKPQRNNIEYEKVSTSDFLMGVISDIEYDEKHTFKGFGKNPDGTPKPDRIASAARFKFSIEGYKFPHYSRWLSFSYGEKSNLFQKYLVPLVEGAKPDMDFDLDQLKGLKVKMLWTEKNNFQTIETIRPATKKIVPMVIHDQVAETVESEPDDEVPF